MKLPVVLSEYRVVIVSQMDLISLGRQTTRGSDGKKSGVDWSKRNEVWNGRKELQVQDS